MWLETLYSLSPTTVEGVCVHADRLPRWSTQGQSWEDGNILSVSCDKTPAGM